MTFDPLRRGSNRDRRDQAFARSVIAEATRRHNMEPCDLECGDRFFKGLPRCRHNRDVNESISSLDIVTKSFVAEDIAASNARQNDYWRRVGGHPDAGYQDGPDKEFCAFCNAPLDCDPEPNPPYCSTQCAIEAENDSRD